MSFPFTSLDPLGWSAFYAQTLSLDELTAPEPARVISVQRGGLSVLAERGLPRVAAPPGCVAPDGCAVTVGDWILVERCAPRLHRVLARRTLIARQAAGTGVQTQPIAANVDTLFVVTSCNADFNPSRLERYFTLARHAHVQAVLVLTKSDLCGNAEEYLARAREWDGRQQALALDATSDSGVALLMPWLKRGQTVAFVGSSGVGKSTLVNTLRNGAAQRTAEIRADDARGRHTTAARRLFALPCGAWVIDTPGMRELAIGAVSSDALDDVLQDVAQLARDCRFRDCAHRGDSGCALAAAVAAGLLDPRRLASYLKLLHQARRATRTAVERHTAERRFGRLAREVMRDKRRRRDP
jgi:ribosome biogenesis GTPase